MAAIEVGRKCIKTAGREAGKDEVKNRRCNINHLEPIME